MKDFNTHKRYLDCSLTKRKDLAGRIEYELKSVYFFHTGSLITDIKSLERLRREIITFSVKEDAEVKEAEIKRNIIKTKEVLRLVGASPYSVLNAARQKGNIR